MPRPAHQYVPFAQSAQLFTLLAHLPLGHAQLPVICINKNTHGVETRCRFSLQQLLALLLLILPSEHCLPAQPGADKLLLLLGAQSWQHTQLPAVADI
jgi:hypothetical protein